MPNQLDTIRLLTGRHSPKVPPHIHSASKGGKVPGIPRANRKYPDGKPKHRSQGEVEVAWPEDSTPDKQTEQASRPLVGGETGMTG